MNLDYYTLLCPVPISLSIGTIRQPTLREIGEITFFRFGMYQVYIKLTPKEYYTVLNTEKGEKFWNLLTEEQRENITLYDVILFEKSVLKVYLDIFNFFFVERVIFRDNLFFIIKTDDYSIEDKDIKLTENNVCGVITPNNILEILDIIQQICCIKSNDPLDEQKPKFKNEKAKRLYERMLKAKEKQNNRRMKKEYYNLTLPNIISATAYKVHGLNILNIWDATLFQVYDQFEKAQNDDAHYMNCVRVAVWGDEKNQFDPSLWYKNNFDKQNLQND